MRALVLVLAISTASACSDDSRTGSNDFSVSMPDAVASSSDLDMTAASTADAGIVDLSINGDGGGVSAYYSINHILSTGQSLSLGQQGTPALSIIQPYANLMFNTGVVAGGTGLSSFIPLVESGQETMSSGMANLISAFALAELPAPAKEHDVLVSCHGVGATAYDGLKKGTVPYANGMAQVMAAKAISATLGRSYVVRAVTVVHGESDNNSGNTHYAMDVETWQHDYETDVQAITGQTEPVPMFHSQMSSWTQYGTATSLIPMAQLQAALDKPGKVILVGPKYFLTYASDGVHLTNDSYREMGEYYAKAYRAVVLQHRSWEPLRPTAAALTGNVIRVKFIVPVPPLVLDTTFVSDPGNLGFEYADDTANPPVITDVRLIGTDTVQITLSSAPATTNVHVRYAFTGKPGNPAGPLTGARGNLRDSDEAMSRNGYHLYNWAIHFDLPVQ